MEKNSLVVFIGTLSQYTINWMLGQGLTAPKKDETIAVVQDIVVNNDPQALFSPGLELDLYPNHLWSLHAWREVQKPMNINLTQTSEHIETKIMEPMVMEDYVTEFN